MPPQQQLQTLQENHEFLLKLVSALGTIVLSCLMIIYGDYRKKRLLKELIRRKRAQNIKRQNEIVKIATESYAKGPKPTLQELVKETRGSWKLDLSEEDSEDDNG